MGKSNTFKNTKRASKTLLGFLRLKKVRRAFLSVKNMSP